MAVATKRWSEARRLQLPRRRFGKDALNNHSAVHGAGAHLEEGRGLCDPLTQVAEVLSALAGLRGPSASGRGIPQLCPRARSQQALSTKLLDNMHLP